MEQTQAVVEEHYAALRGRDWDRLNELYAPEVEYEDPEVSVTGDSAVMSRARNLEAPFSDVDLALRSIDAGEERCTVEWTYQGTNHAPIRTHAGVDFPATGRKITIKGISVFELRAGRIIRERSYWDTASVYGQLGLLTDPVVLGSW